MKRIIFTVFICSLIGCTAPEVPAIQAIESPAAPGSSLPRLFTDSRGDIYLSWVEKSADKTSRLLYTRLEDSNWGQARPIASGNDWFVNWADFPSLVVNNDQMAAHWLQKSDLGTYDYDVRLSFSSNKGESWGASIIPHKDRVAAEHGFVSMLPMEEGKTFITWLDGRNTKNESGETAMTLRAGIFDQEGNTLQEWELDNRVCDCCQTAAAMTDQGPVVIYRDRSENEIRDMSVVRLVNGEWTQPSPLAVELWEIAGCPVNGPAITAQGRNVAAAWFNAKGGTPKVKLAFSEDAGASFGQPVLVSEGITSGRVGLTSLANGDVVVTWMGNKNQQAQVMAARYDRMGTLIKKLEVAQTSAERSSGFPVVTSFNDDVYVAWTETGEASQVRTAKINL